MFADAIRVGMDAVRDVAGLSVVYSDGANHATVTAIPARGPFANKSTTDTRITITTRDWLIDVAGFTWSDGRPIEPRAGHTITESGSVYVVESDDGTEAASLDDTRTRWRIRSRLRQ